MQRYDVIITGGGLAGLTLSAQLARKGFHVALFEKERYPFHRVCGEYIAMESWNYLRECGIDPDALRLPRITTLQVSAPSGNLITHPLDPGGYGISRFTLDNKLAARARKSGVDVFEGVKVQDVKFNGDEHQVSTTAGPFSARIALGSYGKRSNLDMKLGRDFVQSKAKGFNNYIAVKYHVEADLPDHTIALHNFSNGYCGISKVDENRYCLCYLTTAANLNRCANDIARMEQEILMQNPILRGHFHRFRKLYDEPLAISQISFATRTQSSGHMLMLGDAAGLITPLCGNGMSMALHASSMLSGMLPEFLQNRVTRQQLEQHYTAAWNRNFAGRLKAGRILQSLFGKTWMTNSFLAAVKPFPPVVSALIRLTHGSTF